MAKLRLNTEHRLFLRRLARKNISCPAETKADTDAYEKAAKVVRAAVLERYPTKDMNILRRYSVAYRDTCLRLQLAAGGIVQFDLRGTVEEVGLWVPDGNCSNHIYQIDEAGSAVVSASLSAAEALEDAIARKHEDYVALIEASKTLEQVEEVWPEASALREHVGRALPSVLSDDVIARIKEDVALRAAA